MTHAMLHWQKPSKKPKKTLLVLIFSDVSFVEDLNLSGLFTAHFINARPSFISASTYMCIITDERNLGITIKNDSACRILKSFSSDTMKLMIKNIIVIWNMITNKAPRNRFDVSLELYSISCNIFPLFFGSKIPSYILEASTRDAKAKP